VRPVWLVDLSLTASARLVGCGACSFAGSISSDLLILDKIILDLTWDRLRAEMQTASGDRFASLWDLL